MKTLSLLYAAGSDKCLGLVESQTDGVVNYFDEQGKVVVGSGVVHCVDVPDWLSNWDFIRHSSSWRVAWAMGVDKTWAQAWQEFLVFHVNGAMRFALVRLLRTENFRSCMGGSAREQLVEWLDTEPKSRKYNFPLSRRQLDFLVYVTDRAMAKRLEANAREEIFSVAA